MNETEKTDTERACRRMEQMAALLGAPCSVFIYHDIEDGRAWFGADWSEDEDDAVFDLGLTEYEAFTRLESECEARLARRAVTQ